MGDLFGSKGNQGGTFNPGSGGGGGFYVTGGGMNAPFEYGPSAFDLGAISDAVGGNTTAMENRYNQLGLGGSTMEGQDVTGAQSMGTALTGQEQTTDVTKPAINPALQPQLNQLVGVASPTPSSSSSGSSTASSIGTLLGLAGKAFTGGL